MTSLLPLPYREGPGEGSAGSSTDHVSNNQIKSRITNNRRTHNSLRRRHIVRPHLRLYRPPRRRLIELMLKLLLLLRSTRIGLTTRAFSAHVDVEPIDANIL